MTDDDPGLIDEHLDLDAWLEKTHAGVLAFLASRPPPNHPPKGPSKNGNCRTKRVKTAKEAPKVKPPRRKAATS
jgi:hypothetical protein